MGFAWSPRASVTAWRTLSKPNADGCALDPLQNMFMKLT